MKKVMLLSVFSFLSVSFLVSCENKREVNDLDTNSTIIEESSDSLNDVSMESPELENTVLVPTGTYTGVARVVDLAEKEIYVETNDGKMLELYFTESTKLTRNGEDVSFDLLKQGAKVEVTVENKGDKMEPQSVKITD